MVDNKGYPAALKEVAFEPGFCLKGLVFDTETGDVLKIDEHGAICRARHGFAAPFLTQVPSASRCTALCQRLVIS